MSTCLDISSRQGDLCERGFNRWVASLNSSSCLDTSYQNNWRMPYQSRCTEWRPVEGERHHQDGCEANDWWRGCDVNVICMSCVSQLLQSLVAHLSLLTHPVCWGFPYQVVLLPNIHVLFYNSSQPPPVLLSIWPKQEMTASDSLSA